MSHETVARSYEQSRLKGGNPRETEGRALLEAARRMSDAQNRPDDKKAISEVARLNWRLWTILQAEICAPECPLPEDLRVNMLNLCNFVDKHMVDVLASPTADKLDIMININRQIAAGLLTDVSQRDKDAQDGQEDDAQILNLGVRGQSV